MLSATEFISAANAGVERGLALQTGLRELDELTGGVRAGDAWLLTAAPQQGRSTLASQLALRSAVVARRPTWYISPLADSHLAAARMLSTQARIPLHRLLQGRVEERERTKLGTAKEAIGASRLLVMTDHMLPDLDRLADAVSEHKSALVVLDDLDDWAADWPTWLSRLSLHGKAVIGTVAHESVAPRAPASWQLSRTASQAAEVILDVRTLEIPNWQLRPGEAELHILQHRHGPLATLDVAWQPYFGRFLSLGSPGGSYRMTPADGAED